MVTVHTERSSYPCFAAALSGSPTESVEVMAQYLVQTAYEEFKVQLPKEKYRPARQAKNFVG